MRSLAIVLPVTLLAGCSPWLSLMIGELEPAQITKMTVPRAVKVREAISVELTVIQPSSCDTFSHINIERRNDGRLYVLKAFNRVDLSQEGRCALIQSSTQTVALLPDAPIGMVTLSNEDQTVQTTVIVE